MVALVRCSPFFFAPSVSFQGIASHLPNLVRVFLVLLLLALLLCFLADCRHLTWLFFFHVSLLLQMHVLLSLSRFTDPFTTMLLRYCAFYTLMDLAGITVCLSMHASLVASHSFSLSLTIIASPLLFIVPFSVVLFFQLSLCFACVFCRRQRVSSPVSLSSAAPYFKTEVRFT